MSRRWSALALGVVFGGFALRVTRLNVGSLWGDEGFSVVPAGYGGWDIPTAFPIGHLSLYYHLVHLWMSVAGGSEFSLRYLSLWTGVAAVVVACAVGKRVGGAPTGVVAALLCAVSPPLVDYAQTARPYALVVFLLGLNCYALLRIGRRADDLRWWTLAVLSLVAAAYCHLFALVCLPATLLVCALAAWRDPRRRTGLAVVCAGLVLALAPWLIDSFGVTYQAVAARAAPVPFTLAQYLTVVGDGLLVGNTFPGGSGDTLLIGIVAALGLLVGGVALWRRLPGPTAVVVACVLLPLAFGYLIVSIVPYFDGRYLLFIVVPASALIGGSLHAARRPALAVVVLPTLALVALSAPLAYQQAILSPREDLRSLAAAVRARAQPGDALVVNSEWRQMDLDYYLQGLNLPTTIVSDGPPARSADVQSQIDAATKARQRVWVVLYGAPAGTATGYVGTTLRERFAEVSSQWYGTTELALFQAPPPSAAVPRPLDVTFGDGLELVSRTLLPRQSIPPGAGVVVPLNVQVGQPGDYALSLRLVDRNGQVWAQSDGPVPASPAASPARKTDTIDPGLAVPLAAPPGVYHLVVAAYDPATSKALGAKRPNGTAVASQVDVGRVAVRRSPAAPPLAALSIARPLHVDLGQYVLLGGDWPDRLAAGDNVNLSLFWQAKSAATTGANVVVELVDAAGKVRSTVPLPLDSATRFRMAAGEVRQEKYGLRVPPVLVAGTFRLEVGVATAGSQPARLATLGSVQVTSRARRFAAPPVESRSGALFGGQITLVGFDLVAGSTRGKGAVSVKAGSRLSVTLVWQASHNLGVMGIPRDETVFVQALDQKGNLVAQDDGMPASGSAPTTSWAPGEVVADPHTIVLPATLPPGTYTLIAGLYDAQTLARLRTATGDHVVLTHLTVSPALKGV
ncbi:MAG TPA: glycosyltransferase family 39 protein [Chloroflexota bacterium]|nr:glycosyltransferase family 39 protein [Chloroflexota bacterium]